MQGVLAGMGASAAVAVAVASFRLVQQRSGRAGRRGGSSEAHLPATAAHFTEVTELVEADTSVSTVIAVCCSWEQALDRANGKGEAESQFFRGGICRKGCGRREGM